MANKNLKCCNIMILLCLLLNELFIAAMGWTFHETFESFGISAEDISFLNWIKWSGFIFCGLSTILLIITPSECTLKTGSSCLGQCFSGNGKSRGWIVIILFLLSVKVGTISYFWYRVWEIHDVIAKSFRDIFENYIETLDSAKQDFIHSFEKELHCCGLNNLSDWKDNQTELEFCREFPQDPNSHYYDIGCEKTIGPYLEFIQHIFAMAFGIIFVFLILHCIIYCSAKKTEIKYQSADRTGNFQQMQPIEN